MSDLGRLTTLVKAGHADEAGKAVRRRLHSERVMVALHRDLARPFLAPTARLPVTIRPLSSLDRDVFGGNLQATSGDDAFERISRLEMLDAGLATGYAAVDDCGNLCYVQWLMGAAANGQIRELFSERFPPLQPEEALLEGAYTFPAYRGLGVMANAMARIAEIASGLGARRVITFVDHDNVPSLKGCLRAGFQPFALRVERRFLRRRVEYLRLPPAFSVGSGRLHVKS